MIDTDILIDAERGAPDAIAFLTSQHARAGVHISIVSAMELVAGCRNTGELVQVQAFLQQITVLPITLVASRTALQLMETYFLSHRLLIPDSLIAATALDNGFPLYTKNAHHFQMISLLQVIRPY